LSTTARAIYFAVHHPERREYYVGWSTVKAIVGNKLAPSLGDRYLARDGYDSQQHDGPDDPNRPNNLWEPLPGDYGAHGAFDEAAKSFSMESWLGRHARWLALTAGFLTLCALAKPMIKKTEEFQSKAA
jgi:hypothetical protein